MNNQGQGSLANNLRQIQQKRDERRKIMDEKLKQKQQLRDIAAEANVNCDYEFHNLLQNTERLDDANEQYQDVSNFKINIAIRKRPLLQKEEQTGELDIISTCSPFLRVHECKVKVDGITKYVENHDFKADQVYSHTSTSESLYKHSVSQSLQELINKTQEASKDDHILTCFAYGQTGSGKTFTMKGLNELSVRQIFHSQAQGEFFISFYEIYSGKPFDLLNDRAPVKILEDKHQRMQIYGLTERQVQSQQEMMEIIEFGLKTRTTYITVANDTSSRSHCVCQITVKAKSTGKLLLVDLAGSEWDTQLNQKDRRQEAAEINKSLLALKECIRALDNNQRNNKNKVHVPFRGSKMTLMLKDSFVVPSAKVVMIVCISPALQSSDHTIMTLRYATRLKENFDANQNLLQLRQQQNWGDEKPVNGVDNKFEFRNQSVVNTRRPKQEEEQEATSVRMKRQSSQKHIHAKQFKQKNEAGDFVDIGQQQSYQHLNTLKEKIESGMEWDKKQQKRARKQLITNKESPERSPQSSAEKKQLPPLATNVRINKKVVQIQKESVSTVLPPLNQQHTPNNYSPNKQQLARNEESSYSSKISLSSAINQSVVLVGQGLIQPKLKTLKQKMQQIKAEQEEQSDHYSVDEDEVPSPKKSKQYQPSKQEFLHRHVQLLKQGAKLLEKEGSLLQEDSQGNAVVEIESYVEQMSKIVHQKLNIYNQLRQQLLLHKQLQNKQI